jgi:leader peptidase (prepilin peptidase)/N-methyltransferase
MEFYPFWQVAAPVLAAPFIGSFLGVAAMRWGGTESAIVGRSRCDACRHVLSPAELVPLLSYAALRGRCRFCATPIALFHPAMEIGALLIAGLSASFMPPALVGLAAALGWTLLLLAAIDLKTYLLPDLLTLPLIAGGLAFAVITKGDVWPYHALGAAIAWAGAAALAALYERVAGRPGLGGGDVKLFAAAGAWVGVGGLPSVMILAAGGALAVMLLALGAGFTVTRTTRIPFGPFFVVGFYAVWLLGPLGAS